MCGVNDVQFIKPHRIVFEGFGGFLGGCSRVIHCITDATDAVSAFGEIGEHDLYAHQFCNPLNELSNELHGSNQRGKNRLQSRVKQRANRLCQHIQLGFQNFNLVGGAVNGLRKVALNVGGLLHNGNVTQNRFICLR